MGIAFIMFFLISHEHVAMPAETVFVVAVELHVCCRLHVLYMKLSVDALLGYMET